MPNPLTMLLYERQSAFVWWSVCDMGTGVFVREAQGRQRTWLKPLSRIGLVALAAVTLLNACSSGSDRIARSRQPDIRPPAPRLVSPPTQSTPSRAWAAIKRPFSRAPQPRKPKSRGYRKIGNPYQIKGIWYRPRHDPSYDEVGIASFYAHDFHNKLTANGETFDMHALTAAHKTLPLPSYVIVENLQNGRRLKVRVNDRGPFVAGRIIDLSKRAAAVLGFKKQGLARVRVTYVGEAPLDGSTDAERAFLARQSWSGRVGLTR